MIPFLKAFLIALWFWMVYIVVSTSLESSLFENWDFLASIPWMRATLWDFYANILLIPKADALTGYYYNAAAGFVTNCVKLIPLGQHDGQEILFSLQPLIKKLWFQSNINNFLRELIILYNPNWILIILYNQIGY